MPNRVGVCSLKAGKTDCDLGVVQMWMRHTYQSMYASGEIQRSLCHYDERVEGVV